MKKVAIVGTAGIPSRYGGFETLTENLVRELGDKVKFTVYCSGKVYAKEEQMKTYNGARLKFLPLSANGVQSIPYDIMSILHALLYADTLLVLGVSGGILLPLVRLFSRKKIIVNIDGLEWRRDKWGWAAKRFLRFSERVAVKFSHADIADNMAIKKYTALQYKTISHLIAYGGDHAKPLVLKNELVSKYSFLGEPYAFKVCRIEPENNIHVVLEAFSQLPEKTLVMIGNWKSSDYGVDMKDKFSAYANIHLLDPIYDPAILDQIRSNCSLYVHGHSAGGTNPSLVEAMSLALPVLAYNVAYNVASTENKAAYFKSVETLIEQINSLSPARLEMIAQEMKEVADRKYVWKLVAKQYLNLVYAFDFSYVKRSVYPRWLRLSSQKSQRAGMKHLTRERWVYLQKIRKDWNW